MIYRLKSCDGETFEVDESIASQFENLKSLIDDDDHIVLPRVTSKTLAMVIRYCKRHVYADHEQLKAFDSQFVTINTLVDLIIAASDLEIKSLLDLTTKTACNIMRGMTTDELRKMYHSDSRPSPRL